MSDQKIPDKHWVHKNFHALKHISIIRPAFSEHEESVIIPKHVESMNIDFLTGNVEFELTQNSQFSQLKKVIFTFHCFVDDGPCLKSTKNQICALQKILQIVTLEELILYLHDSTSLTDSYAWESVRKFHQCPRRLQKKKPLKMHLHFKPKFDRRIPLDPFFTDCQQDNIIVTKCKEKIWYKCLTDTNDAKMNDLHKKCVRQIWDDPYEETVPQDFETMPEIWHLPVHLWPYCN